MSTSLTAKLDSVLARAVESAGGVPGVVAMATDRNGNFFEGAHGVRQLGQPTPMTTDTVIMMASCTKAVTGVAVMQMVEEGLVSLDDPAKRYVPAIAELQVLTGFDTAGQPQLRPPVRDITLRHLMLHTSGLCYEFFSSDEARFRTVRGLPSVFASNEDAIKTCLVHDPGDAWSYGTNIDWLGNIVEEVRGSRLGKVMRERIFQPLGMAETSFEMTPDMAARRAIVHQRAADGQLSPVPELALPQPPVKDMGGHGLYATTGDYMKFIRMMLNDGTGPHGRVLKAETVAAMARNGLGELKTGAWQSAVPSLANSGDLFPGYSKSWAMSFQYNDEPLPTGRPAGSLSWAGIANCYYWIDRQNGLGGMWCTQILPFLDIASWPACVEFEATVYRARA